MAVERKGTSDLDHSVGLTLALVGILLFMVCAVIYFQPDTGTHAATVIGSANHSFKLNGKRKHKPLTLRVVD